MLKITNNIFFRIVETYDAEFILSLRNDQNLNKFLNNTKQNVSNQINWIENYKKREKKKEEFYFIICDDTTGQNLKIGTIRIYNIKNHFKEFTWGSWILKKNSIKSAAIESMLTLYSFAFEKMQLSLSKFDVRKNNLNVIKIHNKSGAKKISSDEENFYFEFNQYDFIKLKKKYTKFLNN